MIGMVSGTERSAGFPPIARSDARVLILGSLPGVRSIAEGEYYAHPRNAFWPIMSDLAGATGEYPERCAALLDKGIAVWDVLASSVRPGSLDANIDLQTAQVNNFEKFFAAHANVARVCFNGQAAAKIFAARVPPNAMPRILEKQTLPSTSPAHAAMNFAEKLTRWRDGLGL